RDWKSPDALAARGEDRVANRGMGRHRAEFTGAADFCTAFNKARRDLRRFPKVNRIKRVKICLLHLAACKCHFGSQSGQAPNDAALDVRRSDTWIERLSQIDGTPDLSDLDFLVRDGKLDHLGDIAVEGFGER